MNSLMILHIIFMALAVVLVVSAAAVARARKADWPAKHKSLALTGSACALAGFAYMFGLKLAKHYPHFHSPHAVAGAIALLLLIVTPLLGLLFLWLPAGLRAVHRTLGRITALAIVATAVMGVLRLLQILKR